MKNIAGIYMLYASAALDEYAEMEARRQEKLKAFWVKWRNLQNLPRKKKKRVKKHLMWEYTILTWDPMKELNFF